MEGKIRIEVLFPEIANLYGDLENIEYLKKSYPEVEVVETHLTGEPEFMKETPSLIYMGTKKSYDAIGIPHNIWEQLPLILFGYNFSNEEAAKHPLCKFNHDIYKKMCEDFKRGSI